MKFRVKDTNETLPVAQDSYICGLRPDGNDVEFSVKDVELIPDDWSSFRREAAKDILVGICANWGRGFAGNLRDMPNRAIELADVLIAKLKEK